MGVAGEPPRAECIQELAQVWRVLRKSLAGIEQSLRNPSLENIVKLANALETSLPELFTVGAPKPGRPSRPSQPTIKSKTRRH